MGHRDLQWGGGVDYGKPAQTTQFFRKELLQDPSRASVEFDVEYGKFCYEQAMRSGVFVRKELYLSGRKKLK